MSAWFLDSELSTCFHVIIICTYTYIHIYQLSIYVGRVLNRFSKDIGFIDAVLPYQSLDFLTVSKNK